MIQLLTEREAAKLLSVSVHKLRRDRRAGGGIPFVKLSKNGGVRYSLATIEQFIMERTRQSTSEN